MHCAQALLLTTMLALAGGGLDSGADWPRVCPSQQFCFRHPPDLQLVPQQVIDSLAGQYQSPQLQLDYDMGWYSSQFAELTDADVEAVVIDSRAGEVLTSKGIMALRIPVVQDRIRFSMLLQFSAEVDPIVGHKIFNSIEFTLSRQ